MAKKITIECAECGAVLELKVCRSAAGYYLGYFCSCCGPYDRVSGYMDEATAKIALERCEEVNELNTKS